MSCPFGHGSARSAYTLQAEATQAASASASASASSEASSPQNASSMRLWTGGLRTSLGAETAHPIETENATSATAPSVSTTNIASNVIVPPASTTSKYTDEITYWDYIHPDVLTTLQTGREGKGLNHHEEHLFILVHQVFELWFKQIIFELEYVRDILIDKPDVTEINPLSRAVQRLDRADKIMRLATEGYSIMETMDPSDFLEFRDWLTPSSGFQSVQLREIEIMLGLKDNERIPCAGRFYREAFYANKVDKTNVFDKRLSETSLKDALFIFINNHLPLKKERLEEFLTKYFAMMHTQNSEKSKDFEDELKMLESMSSRCVDEKEQKYIKDLQEKAKLGRQLARNNAEDVRRFFADPELGLARTSILFLMTYHTGVAWKDISALIAGFVKIEQAMLLWRNRHARMVEVFIGRRMGTGGTSGVEYIDQTASQYRIFTDLWRIRSLVIARSKIQFQPTEEELKYA